MLFFPLQDNIYFIRDNIINTHKSENINPLRKKQFWLFESPSDMIQEKKCRLAYNFVSNYDILSNPIFVLPNVLTFHMYIAVFPV